MARVPIVKREQVPEQFREAFDALTAESGESSPPDQGRLPSTARRWPADATI